MRKGTFFKLGSAQRCHHLGYFFQAGQCAALSSFRVGKCYFCRKRVCFFTKLTKGCRSKRVGILIYYTGKGYFLTGHSEKGN